MTDPGQPLSNSPDPFSPHSVADSMDPIDHSIETVLTSLREAEPSPGLNRRLLDTIASLEAATASNSGRRPSPRLSAVRAAGWLSLAATLVLTLSLAFLHQHHLAPTPSTATTVPSVTSEAPISTSNPQSNSSDRREEPPHVALSHGAQRRAHPQAAALHSTRLASFPAPPLPLTPQEKLLLRVAHAQNPQQSPTLNPALRASLAARDNENFQIFFAPATTIKPYEPSN